MKRPERLMELIEIGLRGAASKADETDRAYADSGVGWLSDVYTAQKAIEDLRRGEYFRRKWWEDRDATVGPLTS